MTRILTVTLNPALDLSTETARVKPDVKLRCAAPRLDAGGGGVNVSRAIRILGGESVPIVDLGGPVGEQMRTIMFHEGLVPHDLGLGHPTRQSLAVRDLSSGAQYRFVMPGMPWSGPDCAAATHAIADTVTEGDLLVASGSLPPGVPADFFSALAGGLSLRGVRMILDTSGAALAAAAAAADSGAPLYVLRMDREEAESLAGGPVADLGALADLAQGLVTRGVAAIIAVASGAEGTVVATARGRWLCRPPVVEVVSKVGAGDSFVAGFTLALAREATAAEACAQGVAAATSAVTTADTALCEGDAVERYLRDVETVAL